MFVIGRSLLGLHLFSTLIVSSSLMISFSTTVCHYNVIILLVISIIQIHQLVGKTPLVIFIYYFLFVFFCKVNSSERIDLYIMVAAIFELTHNA